MNIANRRRRVKQPQTPALTILSHSTLVDSLYAHLSIGDILNLQLVCAAVYGAVRKWFPAGYNVELHFRRYFDNPLSFRVLQAKTGTLVSGSNALQFFERSYYPDSDMDLYVPCRHTYTVSNWILQNGYTFVPSASQLLSLQMTTPVAFFEGISRRTITIHDQQPTPVSHDYGWSAVEDVFTFIHTSKPGLKVQLVAVDPRATPVTCILFFHSTLVMNFIAWDKAYSLFPAATFLSRDCLTFGDVKRDPSLPGIYAKYWQRGFKISAVPVFAPTHPKSFVLNGRWIGDQHSWVIDLQTEEVLRIVGLEDESEWACRGTEMAAGFTLLNRSLRGKWKQDMKRNPDRCGYKEGAPAIHWEEIYSPILKSILVLPLTIYGDSFWRLKGWVQAQEEFEKEQVRAVDPHANLEVGMNAAELPGWKYWDKEVLGMLLDVKGTGRKCYFD